MQQKIYVLDASVVLHNWVILRDEKTKIIPFQCLQDIQKFQTQSGQIGDNARNACNFIAKNMEKGLNDKYDLQSGGQIILWKHVIGPDRDQRIFNAMEQIKQKYSSQQIILLSKKASMRIKANNYGFNSEDYDDVGMVQDINGWRQIQLSDYQLTQISYKQGQIFQLKDLDYFGINEYLVVTVNGKRQNGMVFRHLGEGNFIVLDRKPHMCGIVPKNLQQIMLADSLMNDDIPLVTCVGCAGSGKTLLSIASAIQKVTMEKKYRKIIITRPVMPIGKDLGFLPGTVDEKMAEWIRPFMDNIDYIKSINYDSGKRKVSMTKIDCLLDIEKRKQYMQILPLTYIRGSSISNAYIIVDQAQNATPAQMKTIITRVGQGSKLVLLGDVNQIDNRFLSKQCNGLSLAVKKFHNNKLFSHVTVLQSERSQISKLATDILF